MPPQAGMPTAKPLFKDMLQGSGMYSIALIGQRLIGVILLPITTRFLAPSDYGVLDLLEQVSSVLALLLGASFSSAIGYFYFQTESVAARQRVVTTTVVGAGLIGVAAALLSWPFAETLSRTVFGTTAVAYSLYVVFVTLPPTFLVEGLLAWLRVEDRRGMWVLGSVIRLAVTTAGVVLFVAALRLRVVGVQYAALAAAVVPAVILSAYCFKKNRFAFEFRTFWRMAAFAAPLGLSGIAMFIINFGDRFVLRHYVSFADMGLYALAYKIGLLISAVYASFHIYWSAQVFAVMRRDDAQAVFGRITTYVVLAIAFCGLGTIVWSKPALRVLATPAYYAASQLVPVLVVAYCIRSVGELFRCLFLVEGRPGYDAISTWISCLVCLAGYLLLIPPFGVWGAAVSTLVTFALFTGISAAWTYRLRPYRLETRRLAKIGVALAIPAALYAAFPMASLEGQIEWAAALTCAFVALLWLMQFPSPAETEALLTAKRSIAKLRYAGRVQ